MPTDLSGIAAMFRKIIKDKIINPQQTPSQEASSSRRSFISTEQVEQELSLQTDVHEPSKQVTFHRRPMEIGYIDDDGIDIKVKTNYFFVDLLIKDYYHYDVSITPEDSCRMFNRSIIEKLVERYKRSCFGGHLPVYDGRKNLFTAAKLPFVWKSFEIIPDEDRRAGRDRPPKTFNVVIKFASKLNLSHLTSFMFGEQEDAPQEFLQMLDIVLREKPTATCYPIGRSFFPHGEGYSKSLSDGVQCRNGFYQSIRAGLSTFLLKIDMSSTTFISPMNVVVFVNTHLEKDAQGRMLNPEEWATVNKFLKGVKVKATHREKEPEYRIVSLTEEPAINLKFLSTFPLKEEMKSVIDYFEEKYQLIIEHPYWPCLQVGNSQKPNYLPMEVCQIVEGQKNSKKLNGDQVNKRLREACMKPQDRQNMIYNIVRKEYYSNEYTNEFGIKIEEDLGLINARRLYPPQVKYKISETGMEQICYPLLGKWDMYDKGKDLGIRGVQAINYKKMVNGGTVRNWTCICFADEIEAPKPKVHKFCSRIASICQNFGMEFNPDSLFDVIYAQPKLVGLVFNDIYHMAMEKNEELDLFLVILRDKNDTLYGELKRICETEIGIVSQCFLKDALFKKKDKLLQYIANVALKINVKLGGKNSILVDALPKVSKVPTIIFGADVNHPQPRDESSPSIAAVVASLDWPDLTKYAGRVSAQAHRQELIDNLYKSDPHNGNAYGGMIMDLLRSFQDSTSRVPERLIFYRDGVSKGQFNQVLDKELKSIKKACTSLYPEHKVFITFVVVQKRHHTRFFADNTSNMTESGNILPGTVVDSEICHPFEFDFYLCSHEGIRGTSRPAHYHVLCDENNFTKHELEVLTYKLCYTYARCTRSVSIVPPAYYAHLLASRARCYMGPTLSENPSQPKAMARRAIDANEPNNTSMAIGGAIRQLPAIKEKIKNVMFFC